ncbi:hypothetical protein ACFLT7_02880 [candidate division KSB1 bacterium]
MEFIICYWYLWVIGLFVFPLIAVLPQLKNIIAAVDDKGANPEEVGKLFLTVKALFVSILGGMGFFVSFVLFFVWIILVIIDYIKG